MKYECVITGVRLVHPWDSSYLPADLFEMGDMYIVNAAVGGDWGLAQPIDLEDKTLRWIRPNLDAWTQRGVYVFHQDNCRISVAALEYMGK